MCHLVHSYLAGAPCRQRTGNIRLKQSEMSEFNDLILKYTKENILKINIYIKEPFARKYLMVEYASMYEEIIHFFLIKKRHLGSHGSVTSEV